MPYNKILIFIPVIFLISCISKPIVQPTNYLAINVELYSLNGSIKQITTKPADDQPTSNPGQDYDIAYFNQRGDVYKTINGFHGMVSQIHYVTIYDKNGNKEAILGYFKSSDPDLSNPPIMAPPLLTNLKRNHLKTDDQLLDIYRYNKHNQIINHIFDPHKRSADSSTYKYNNNGLLVECDHYTFSKLLMDVTKFKYDNDYNLIESDQYHWTRLAIKTKYQYKKFDSHNNWILMTTNTASIYDGNKGRNFSTKREISYY